MQTTETQKGFDSLGIVPKLIDIITRLGYTTPTPIQHKAIPPATDGKDLLGIAQTGTGKTLAFVVPLIQRLAQTKGRGLVIVPTRELALQVNETFEKVGKTIGLKSVVLIGGAPIDPQIRRLRTNPHVVIGTPGRIIDHIERKSVNLDAINVLVLDEADLMLDMGFAPQINRILEVVPRERQTLLFSATMPAAIEKLTKSYMATPVRVEIARSGSTPDRITQEVYQLGKNAKDRALREVLTKHTGSVIVFVRTKHGAKKLFFEIRKSGHTAAEIHSNRSLAQRRKALDGFKSGAHRVLVATDIAARGIDVSGIALILNYDLPENPEDYVHRIGRTGRAGQKGHAISFATNAQRSLVQRIERLIRGTLSVVHFASSPEDRDQEQVRAVRSIARPTARGAVRGSQQKKRTNYSENYGFRKGREEQQQRVKRFTIMDSRRGTRSRDF